MAYSVAYQHTDGNRNYDGSYELHGIKKVGTDRKSVGPQFYYVPPVLRVRTMLFFVVLLVISFFIRIFAAKTKPIGL